MDTRTGVCRHFLVRRPDQQNNAVYLCLAKTLQITGAKKKKRLISCDNTIVKFRIKRVRGTSYMGSNDEMRRFVGMVDGWMDDHGQASRKSDGCMENSHVLLMHPTSQTQPPL